MKAIYTVVIETGDFRWVIGQFDDLEAATAECKELQASQPDAVSIKITYV